MNRSSVTCILRVAALAATCLTMLVIVSAASAVTLSPTNAPLPGSNFQGGDGNQDNPSGDVSNPPDGVSDIDWQSVPNAAGGLDSITPADVAFAGGTKESAPGAWGFQNEGTGVNPNKDNIIAAWSNSSANVSGSPATFLNLAFTREASTGNTYITFELNQLQGVTWNNGTATIPCRTTGDILISYNIPSGSATTIGITVYGWTTDTYQLVNGNQCAKTGHFTELDPQPYAEGAMSQSDITNYLTNGGLTGQTFAKGTFGEASINLTGILNGLNESPCTNFGQIGMHTRSSESIDSQLQDYVTPVPVIVHTCDLGITKVGSSPKHDGDSETFTYQVTNTGNTPVTVGKTADSGVTDDKCSPVTYVSGDTNNDGKVDTNETWTFTCNYTVQHSAENSSHDIVNTATVHGSVGSVTIEHSTTYTTHVIHPAIDVQKSATESAVHVGDTIHYTVVVTNTGDTSLTVTPSDVGCTSFDNSSFSLAAGDSQTLHCTHVATVGDGASYRNEACAQGVDVLGGVKGTVSDCDHVDTPILHPGISVTKSATEPAVHVGDTIHYTIVVTNTGDTPLTVTPSDLGCTSFDNSSFSLAKSGDAGDSTTLHCVHVATAGDGASYRNEACAQGVDSIGGTNGTVSDCDHVDTPILHPAIAIQKTAAETSVFQGDTIHYTIKVTNTGDTDLTVTPSDLGCTAFDNSAFPLAVGDSKTLTCSHVTTAGDGSHYNNEACAQGVDSLGGPNGTVNACDHVDVPIVEPATVEGTKFHDRNANGARDAGEEGLGGWTFYVDYNGNGKLDSGEPSGTSAADGSYKITGITPGTYAVREVGQAGWTCSFPTTCEHDVTLGSGEDKTGQDFGNWEPATLSGTKWQDTNANGQRDGGEGPLGGFTFYVDYNGNGSLDAGEPAAVSAADGTYTITGIKPGSYKVLEVADPNYTCTFPGTGTACSYQESFGAGDAKTGVDFGNAPPQQIVEPTRIVPGSARLVGPTGCAAKAFNVRVRGTKIAAVTFVLDGKTVKRFTKVNLSGVYTVRVNPTKMKAGVHRLVVSVTFQKGSGTKPKTLRLSFQRCTRKLAIPRFTG